MARPLVAIEMLYQGYGAASYRKHSSARNTYCDEDEGLVYIVTNLCHLYLVFAKYLLYFYVISRHCSLH